MDIAKDQNPISSGQPHISSSPPFTVIVSESWGGLMACVELGACRWLPESTHLFRKMRSPCIVRVVGFFSATCCGSCLCLIQRGASLLGYSEAGSGWRTELRLCPVIGSSFHCWVLCPSVNNSRIFGPKHIWMLIRARLRFYFGYNLFSLGGNSSTGYKVTQEMD